MTGQLTMGILCHAVTKEFISKKIPPSPLRKAPTVGVLSLQGRGWSKERPSLA